MSGDQAGALRELVSKVKSNNLVSKTPVKSRCEVITVTSGKGGVGKSNTSIFLAKALVGKGKKVLLFDGDMGLANLHILLGVTAKYNIVHFLRGERELSEIVHPTVDNIHLLPGSSGSAGLADLRGDKLTHLITQLELFSAEYDYMIVDGGAGISESAIKLTLAGDSVLVVLTTDPTSLADAYSAIKILNNKGTKHFYVIINMVEAEEEAEAIEEKLMLLTEKFLGITPIVLGRLPRERRLSSCIRSERSILGERGLADFSIRINSIASKIIKDQEDTPKPSLFFRDLFEVK